MSIELPVTTRHRRDMTDNAERDVKPEQTNKNDVALRKHAHVMYRLKILLEFFSCFSYFCSKHRLWVHIRKIGIPLHTPVLLYKSGVQGGGYTLHGYVFVTLV